ncbi:hypothetical protein [Acidiplasma sp.]|uniref:hypothetical protein n=1 Tax=Acidiplasma sp. TaxID=1872114 RepID=UPI0031634996
MYNCEEIKSLNIKYMDNTERQLTPDEIKSICNMANDNDISIEMLLKRIEPKPVRCVEINVPPYTPAIKDGKLTKPMPPY